MITFVSKSDLLRDDADALTNTVNCKGVMGKGLALAFKERFPDIMSPYDRACKAGELRPGEPMFLPRTARRPGILLFPTKDHWRKPSRLEWVDAGLRRVAERYVEWGIRSIAMPQLGCGLGGLDWKDVRPLIVRYLGDLDLEVRLHGPPEAGCPADGF